MGKRNPTSSFQTKENKVERDRGMPFNSLLLVPLLSARKEGEKQESDIGAEGYRKIAK